MPEPLRVGIVGCGFQGRLHAEILSGMQGVEVAAICDRDDSRAAGLAAELGIAGVFHDYRALLDDGRYDLVTVCTMPDTHRQITLDAIECGADVLCEKPFALDATQALDMIVAAERAGRMLSVGFNMRFMDGALAMRRFIDEGQLGEPICGRGWMLAGDVPWWGKHYIKAMSGGGALAPRAPRRARPSTSRTRSSATCASRAASSSRSRARGCGTSPAGTTASISSETGARLAWIRCAWRSSGTAQQPT